MKILFSLSFLLPAWAFANLAVICDGSRCPPGAGSMTARDRDHVNFCGFQLVEPNLALTALHCLPEELRRPMAPCHGVLDFDLTIADGPGPNSLSCDHVEAITPTPPQPDNNDVADWALIRLKDRAERRLPRLRSQPLSPESAVRVYAVHAGIAETIASVKEIKCKGVEVGYLFPLTFDKEAPLYFGNCDSELTAGDSGSPVYDSEGQLAGLVTGIVDAHLVWGNPASKSFFGTKTQCIPSIFGTTSAICNFNNQDPGLEALTVLLSVLRSATRAMLSSRPAPETFRKAPSRFITEDFARWYPNLNVQLAKEYSDEHQLTGMSEELDFLMRRLLPRVPACANPGLRFSYNAIALGNPRLFPDESNRLFVKVDREHRLRARVREMRFSVLAERKTLNLSEHEINSDADEVRRCRDEGSFLKKPSRYCVGVFDRLAWHQALPEGLVLPVCP